MGVEPHAVGVLLVLVGIVVTIAGVVAMDEERYVRGITGFFIGLAISSTGLAMTSGRLE